MRSLVVEQNKTTRAVKECPKHLVKNTNNFIDADVIQLSKHRWVNRMMVGNLDDN